MLKFFNLIINIIQILNILYMFTYNIIDKEESIKYNKIIFVYRTYKSNYTIFNPKVL